VPAYTIRKRLISIGRDYAIEDEHGQTVYKMDGKVGFARKFLIKNDAGKTLLSVREKLLSISPMFVITQEGKAVAIVRRTSLSDAMRDKYEIEIDGAVVMKAEGSFFGDGINMHRDGRRVGSVSRKPRTLVEEIFNVSVATSEDQPLVLAVAMSIVEMTRFRGEDRT
jgi:uncharacterized protein YxjI